MINSEGYALTFRGRAGAESNIYVTTTTENIERKSTDWKVEDAVTSSRYNLIRFKLQKENEEEEEEIEVAFTYDSNRINWSKSIKTLNLPEIKRNAIFN